MLTKKHKKLLARLESRAEQYMSTYRTSNQLLQDAFKDATPWVSQMVISKRVPSIPQMETLCAQLLAILAASSPEE